MRATTKRYTKLEKNKAAFFNALGDPRRFVITKLIMREREVCVSDVAKYCNISVSAASQQLRMLEEVDIVFSWRDGQRVCYSLNTSNYYVDKITRML